MIRLESIADYGKWQNEGFFLDLEIGKERKIVSYLNEDTGHVVLISSKSPYTIFFMDAEGAGTILLPEEPAEKNPGRIQLGSPFEYHNGKTEHRDSLATVNLDQTLSDEYLPLSLGQVHKSHVEGSYQSEEKDHHFTETHGASVDLSDYWKVFLTLEGKSESENLKFGNEELVSILREVLGHEGREKRRIAVPFLDELGFQIDIVRLEKPTTSGIAPLQLHIINQNWSKEGVDFKELTWTIRGKTRMEQKETIERLLRNFHIVRKDKDKIQKFFLKEGARRSPDSTRLCLMVDGTYAVKDGMSGESEPITDDDALRFYIDEDAEHKNYLRAGLEIITALGVGDLWYFLTRDTQSEDWDHDWDRESFKEKTRLGEGITFDTNTRYMNVGHALKGAFTYTLARSNHLNPLESFLFSFTGSLVWEYLVEYREKVSINDMIMTPMGGAIIGEVMFQFGQFFNQAFANKKSPSNHLMTLIFGAPEYIHRWVDQNQPKIEENFDENGFSADVWHRFRAEVRSGINLQMGKEHVHPFAGVNFDAELINIRDYDEPGNDEQFIFEPTFHRLGLSVAVGEGDYRDILFAVREAYLGYYKRNIESEGNVPSGLARKSGYTFFIGAASGFEYRDHRTNETKDWSGIVHVLGATMDFNLYLSSGLKVRILFDLFGDFSMVRSYAVRKYETENSLVGAKDVLRKQKYYYAWGMTAQGLISIAYDSFEISFGTIHQIFDSIEDMSRFQRERVTDDFNLQDQRTFFVAVVSYSFTEHGRLVFEFHYQMRDGQIRQFEFDREEVEFILSLGYDF